MGHHFQGQKVKGQDHQAALLTAVLARQAAAAVGMGTCWPWETAATLSSARPREALRRPRGEERGGAYRGGRPPTACLYIVRVTRVFFKRFPRWKFAVHCTVIDVNDSRLQPGQI